ncbi:uncharacterized protein LOC141907490 [Tubulanus polymorphus]|uniref:uncharacterized protein LOC141907490 n=1 Tax=Tubulanus polymorphus TaxID=672921 RepID=UPI003DA4EC29
MAASSKAEYLKRYMSEDADQKPQKKKRKKLKAPNVKKVSGLRIVDDDVDFDSLLPENIDNAKEEDLYDDQAPTIAEVIDERPEHIKQLEQYRTSNKWKTMENISDDENGKNSGPRNTRHDSDSDASPPRKKRHDSDSDASPPRKMRHDSDSDASPPRKKRHDSDSDASPPRKKRHDSDSGASPPRKKSFSSSNKSKEESRNGSRSSAKSKTHRKDTDSDNSPPRKSDRKDSDNSSRRRRSDYSPDLDPSRGKEKLSQKSRVKRSRFEPAESPPPTSKKSAEKMKKTLAGAKAGLQSAKDMKEELEALRTRENKAFSKIDDEVLGKNAATVVRDKSGKRRNLEAERAEEAEEEAKKAKQAEKYNQWGKGLKQTEFKEQNVQDTLHEMSKPLARYKDDADLDEMLKNQERDGDPMLAFLKKKKSAKTKKPAFPRYSGPAPPPNRFNMMPGYRWDGVNRSNGFEKSFYAKQAEKKANREQAYKWSIEDM